jgi:hypothetical protein
MAWLEALIWQLICKDRRKRLETEARLRPGRETNRKPVTCVREVAFEASLLDCALYCPSLLYNGPSCFREETVSLREKKQKLVSSIKSVVVQSHKSEVMETNSEEIMGSNRHGASVVR